MTAVTFIVEDALGNGMRVSIYNSDYNFVAKNLWLAIREPYYKRANDGMDIVRVDDPSDVEFINTCIMHTTNPGNVFEIICLIKETNIGDASITIQTLEPTLLKKT